jgi:hypothetical protein
LNFFVNLRTCSHVSVQVIFLDMIDDPTLKIFEGFPRMLYITDKHLDWLNKQKWEMLDVSTYYAYSSMYFRVHAAC